jgi:hypothetical protein
MAPGEIGACYRLYAAHRKSHEICAFPGTIPAASNAGNLDDLAVLLRLQTGLEELVRDIDHRDPNDDLRPASPGPSVIGERCSHRSLPSRSVAALWWGAEVIGVVGSSKMRKLRSRQMEGCHGVVWSGEREPPSKTGTRAAVRAS